MPKTPCQGSHSHGPQICSGRGQFPNARHAPHFEDAPVEAFYYEWARRWVLEPGYAPITPGGGSQVTSYANGLGMLFSDGDGGATCTIDVAGGYLYTQTSAADNIDAKIVCIRLFEPCANTRMKFYFKGWLEDVSAMHFYVGLTGETALNTSTPLHANDGTLADHEGIGFHWNANLGVLSFVARDAAAADTVAIPYTMLDETVFRCGFELNDLTNLTYFWETHSGTLALSNVNLVTTPFTDPLGVTQVTQNHGAAANLTYQKGLWAYQTYEYVY